MNREGSHPERDRRLAARPRLRYRDAKPLGAEIEALLGSDTFQRLKRFQKVNDVLAQVLTATQRGKIKPISLRAGILTIEVVDGPLLAELRQHHERGLLRALTSAGTGVSRINWRLQRSQYRQR